MMSSLSEIQPLLLGSSIALGSESQTYRVYGTRWYVLLVLTLLNISNGMLWISFSPIADLTAAYYQISDMQVNWLTMVFMVVSIPFGLFATWFMDVVGLRASIIVSAWLNVIGAILRIISCLAIPSIYQFPLVLGGQTLCAMAQPLIMFAPTKLAALWFAADQRAVANTIATTANAIGIMVGNLVSPAVMKKSTDMPHLMYVYAAPAGLVVVMATLGICNSLPPTPPTSSAAEQPEPFIHGIKKIFRNKSYWVLAVSFGMAVAIFTAANSLLEQILCPLGYSDKFAGLCGGLMIVFGLLGAACAAIYADKTKLFVEVAKCGLCLSVISLVAFLVLVRYPNQEVLLLVLICLTGFFGFASNPISLELAVETTFPVAEATSAGILILSGQVQSFLAVMFMQVLARPFSHNEVPDQTCHTAGVTGVQPQDFSVSNLCLSGYGALIVILFVIFYRCDYKRMKAEQCIAAENIIVNSHSQDIAS